MLLLHLLVAQLAVAAASRSNASVELPTPKRTPSRLLRSAAYRCRHHGNSPRRRLHHLTSEPRHRAPVREVRVFIAFPLPLNCKQTKARLHAIQHPANQGQTALQLIMSPNHFDRLDMETPPWTMNRQSCFSPLNGPHIPPTPSPVMREYDERIYQFAHTLRIISS
ncbi:hypothetical protein CLIM01_13452 [Colletotrichum limetticola]|uniref:Secreted protein n=1 Tax=Colletotrichum limetticola TaxID=1209924 RepID=A0ABQ9PBY6_9PEZI|nr:hypothetical protein CLIM01_13452 [Colletotrichum limetticola]